MIRHLVFLRFKNDTSKDVIAGLYENLAGLVDRIDGVLDFQSRENISIEAPLVRDSRHMFWFDFRDTETRDVYLEDEAHKAVGGQIVAELEGGTDGVFVCDIEL